MGGSQGEGAGGPDSPRIYQEALGLLKRHFQKRCVDFDFISLSHSYVLYTYNSLLSRNIFTRLL